MQLERSIFVFFIVNFAPCFADLGASFYSSANENKLDYFQSISSLFFERLCPLANSVEIGNALKIQWRGSKLLPINVQLSIIPQQVLDINDLEQRYDMMPVLSFSLINILSKHDLVCKHVSVLVPP